MSNSRLLKLVLFWSLSFLGPGCTMRRPNWENAETVNKIEMNLSAFGVESDRVPNIRAIVDLKSDTSFCDVSYYDPKFRAFTYRLTKGDMDSIRNLIARGDIRKLKKGYTVSKTDMPSSTTIFYLANDTVKISDYGLEGPFPLQELYRLVYNPEKTVR